LNFAFYIAKRYLLAKKTHNLVNIISWISVISVAVGTMSLIIVLSVFNGFESVISGLFNNFNPDIKIEAKIGKTIQLDNFPIEKIKKIDGVEFISTTIEENALLRYKDRQQIVTIKGVDDNYPKVSRLESSIVEGKYLPKGNNFMVLGYGIFDMLSIELNDYKTPVNVYYPQRDKNFGVNPIESFNSETIVAVGAFSIQQDFDTKYALVPLNFAQKLTGFQNQITFVEISVKKGYDVEKVQDKIQKLVGNEYFVKNRFQQEEMLYKVIKSEKLAIFIILSFLLMIASFNIIGSLSLLIIEKRKDIFILQSLGASKLLIKKVFLTEGLMISFSGAVFGMFIGGLLSWLQQHFGFIPLEGSGSFVIKSYPVQIKWLDFLYVGIIVTFLGILSAWYPVTQISKKYFHKPPSKDVEFALSSKGY